MLHSRPHHRLRSPRRPAENLSLHMAKVAAQPKCDVFDAISVQ